MRRIEQPRQLGELVKYDDWYYWVLWSAYYRLPNKSALQLYFWMVDVQLVPRPTIFIVASGSTGEPTVQQKRNVEALYKTTTTKEQLNDHLDNRGLDVKWKN